MSEKKVPYSRKPGDLSLEEWQKSLRKQFAREQKFKFKNIGDHPVFSDFEVFNPQSEKTYKVSIRDNQVSYNFCSCPDFTITALGTCKHIEFLLHYFSKYKKYQKYLSKPFIPGYSSISIYYGTERKIRLKKPDPSIQFKNEERLFDENGFLIPEKMDELDAFIEDARATDPTIRIYEDVLEMMERYKKGKKWDLIAEKLFPEGPGSEIFQGLINTELYPYQKVGIQKIIETRRILLADDMGLGKTIQAIAATEIFAKHFGVENVLIICPTSLKYQWKREIEKFTGRDALIVEGLIHKRKDHYKTNSFYKIISYGVCRNDLDFINALNPDLVIIDEAQRIKNWKTLTAQAVKKINSPFAIVLTGTPLENRIEELHSIIEYIDRYKLGPLFRFLDRHQVLDEKGKLKGYKDLREINRTLNDVLLRRTKNEILDQLPGRMDKNYFVEMTKEQQQDHDSYYDMVSRLVTLWMRQGFLSEEDREQLLMALNCMRMVCDSTYILNQNTDHGNKIGELTHLLREIMEDPENRIVIFSQWKRMFELVIKQLEKLKIPYLYLNGDIPARKRKTIIEEFQHGNSARVFLSTDAGGVGVNLQRANILINLDLPWNPAVLEQRIGRIYRLGQKKHINVINFISGNSIEHRIFYLLDFKKAVFEGVIEEEGKDEVMLESFMESVRAMTDMDLSEDNTQDHDYSQEFSRNTDPQHEIHSSPLHSHKENSEKELKKSRELHTEGIGEKTGLFGKLKKKINQFIKRIWN